MDVSELKDLTDDGDTLGLADGRKLRLRLEVDEGYSINDYDSDGKTAWGRRDQYGRGEHRPDNFDGHAEKLSISDHGVSLWWQPLPMKDYSIKHGTPEWRAERQRITDLCEYGFKVVILEVLQGVDFYHRPIVAGAASCGGVDSVYPELVDELFDELELTNPCPICLDVPGKDGRGRPCKTCKGTGRVALRVREAVPA